MGWTVITAQWQGIPGAPGWTRIKFEGELDAAGATSAANRVRTFLAACGAFLPSQARISFNSAAQIYNDSGQLSSEVGLTTVPTTVSGSAAGAYAGPTGCVVNWVTGAFQNGRKITGRTYLVPLVGAFDTDGTLGSGTVTTILGAAQALAAGSPGLTVVSRKNGTYVGRVGVLNASIPDRAAVLRSRRD